MPIFVVVCEAVLFVRKAEFSHSPEEVDTALITMACATALACDPESKCWHYPNRLNQLLVLHDY